MELKYSSSSPKQKLIMLLFGFTILRFTFLPLSFLPIFDLFFVPYIIGTIACILAVGDKLLTEKRFLFLFLYIIVLILNHIFEPENVNLGNILSESSTLLFTACIFYYIFEKRCPKAFVNFLIISFVVITIIYFIQTFLIYRTIPGVMRWAAMERNREDANAFFRIGLSPYTFPHALPYILPAIIMGMKNGNQSKVKKMLSLLLVIATLALIYVTQASGAMFLAILTTLLGSVIAIAPVNKNVNKIIVVGLLVSPFLFWTDFQVLIVHSLMQFVGDDSAYMPKLIEIEANLFGIEGEEGDIDYRGNLLEDTFNAILSSPIWGVSEKTYGGHNAFFDRWAEYGLLGIIPLIFFLYMQIKRTFHILPTNARSFYLIAVIAFVFMFCFKGMFEWYQCFFIFVIVPLLIVYFYKDNNKTV